jgi:acetyl-CoA C-acetyltransferase
MVGVGQVRRRPDLDSGGIWEPREPAELMAMAISIALQDAAMHGAGNADEVRGSVEALACVDPICWGYEDLVTTTGKFAEIDTSSDTFRAFTCPPGGNSPGDLLHEVANRVAAGEINVAVLTGSEALYSVRRARKEGVDLQQRWTPFRGKRDFFRGQRPLTTAVEARHGMVAPIHCYPMFENAMRAKSERTVSDHQTYISALMSRNASVAASNPNAWFPDAQSPDDIGRISTSNRWVCFPYPKKMNAIMEVDQAAAVVIMSQSEADRRGIKRSDQVRFLGGGSCQDPWTPAERPNLAESVGIKVAAEAALQHAGIAMGDVDAIDLYSCFPSAVQMGMDALGLSPADPRGVTLTGGLAYAGGPGNSFSVHSMCVAVDRIRNGTATVALVTSLGMTASKHAVSILGNATVAPAADAKAHKEQLSPDQLFGPPLVDGVSGPGTIISYTAEFDRSGVAIRSIYIVDLDDGTRTVGNGTCDEDEINAILQRELVGARVHVVGGAQTGGADDSAMSSNRVVML